MPRFNLDEYVTVQERITKFWKNEPNGRIETEVVAITPNHKDVVIKASIYHDQTSDKPIATGLAQETQGGPSANAASWVENCETSAIGRALANLDYETDKGRASREEMQKVNEYYDRVGTPGQPPPQATQATQIVNTRSPQQGQLYQQQSQQPPNNLITSRQFGMIKGRAKELGLDDDGLDALMPPGKDLKTMTRTEASGFIDYLGQLMDAGDDQDDA